MMSPWSRLAATNPGLSVPSSLADEYGTDGQRLRHRAGCISRDWR
jgi:hypothetical protein